MVALAVHVAPATEPLTISEVMAHLRLDESNQELPPAALSAALPTPAAPGNVNNGAHRYRVVFVTSSGKTQGGDICPPVTVADNTVNGKVSLTAIPVGGPSVTSREIYRTAAGGDNFYLLATIADNTTTTYLDNVADASLGASCPTSNTTSDPMLAAFIAAARDMAETKMNRAIMQQTLDLYLDRFPSHGIALPRPSLISVDSIVYFDSDGVERTLAVTEYQVDTASEPAVIVPAYGKVWPSVLPRHNAIRIRYVAGYTTVPECVKTWMLVQVNTMWETRSQFLIGMSRGGAVSLPDSYLDTLLSGEIVPSFSWGMLT